LATTPVGVDAYRRTPPKAWMRRDRDMIDPIRRMQVDGAENGSPTRRVAGSVVVGLIFGSRGTDFRAVGLFTGLFAGLLTGLSVSTIDAREHQS
jgi:hypothetical protein